MRAGHLHLWKGRIVLPKAGRAEGTGDRVPACHPQAHDSIGAPLGHPKEGNRVICSVPALAPTPARVCTCREGLGEKYQGEINPYLLKKEREGEKFKSEFKSSLFF